MNKVLSLVCYFLLWSYALQAQRIVFTPQWTPQSQFAGYYVAQEKGFYQEAGIEVIIKHPSASYSAFYRLLEGSSDIITMQLLPAMIEIDRGMPLVNVLQTSQNNGLVIVSREETIRTFNDLRGKKVGVWKAGFGDLGYMVDFDMQLGIQWIPFLQGMNLYISGAIDATLAMSYNEYIQIQASGFEDKTSIRFADTGYNFPEDGVYVTSDFYKRYPDKVKAFAEASRRGWEYAHSHPEEALEIVMKVMAKENVPINRFHQQGQLREILKLQCEAGQEKPSFELNPEKIEKLSDLLMKYNRISHPVTVDKLKGGKE